MRDEEETFREITKKDIEEVCKRLREDKILSKFYIIRPKKVVAHGRVYWEVELVRKDSKMDSKKESQLKEG